MSSTLSNPARRLRCLSRQAVATKFVKMPLELRSGLRRPIT